MSNITLATIDQASDFDIVSSEEFLAYRRRDAPEWMFLGEHVAECASCQADTVSLHRANFRAYLEGLTPPLEVGTLLSLEQRVALPVGAVIATDMTTTTRYRKDSESDPKWATDYAGRPRREAQWTDQHFLGDAQWYLRELPESTATPEHTPTDQVDVPSETVAAPPARYRFQQGGGLTLSDGDRIDYGVFDLEAHTFAPWISQNYADSLNDGSLTRNSVSWYPLEPGTVFPNGYVVPAPDLESSQFATWQFAMAHFIYQYVYDQGNVSYYNTLANKGLLPDRHQVRAWRATLTEGGEVNEWLTALGEQALESDMCEVYDRMCEGLKLPTREELGLEREKDFSVEGYVEVTVRVPVSVGIRARDDDAALRIAEENEDPTSYVDRYTIQDAVSNGNWDIVTSEWEEANES